MPRLDQLFLNKPVSFPVSATYKLGLSAVALAMVLLPLLYLAIIALTGYLLYWHSTHNIQLFSSHLNAKVAFFLYVTPIVTGILLLLFMVKPLFAKSSTYDEDLTINRSDEPTLFSFVEKLCNLIGAPVPAEIRINNQVNASASFSNGLKGCFSNRLTLTIGLPLAGGLDLQQFAGVLAHEFGHFAQSSGMRLSYLIRSINHWFARVVFEEDQWDSKLRSWSKEIDFRIGIILYIARFFIWSTRKLLHLLMIIGNAISCYMLRQMEYDADRYEAAVAGAAAFETTSNKISLLSLSHAWAFQDISETWQEGQLPNSLPDLVLTNHSQMKIETRDAVLKDIHGAKTGIFDTHPSTADRIRNAQKIISEPAFHWNTNQQDRSSIPSASILFKDFSALSEKATLDYYKKVLGKTPQKKELINVVELADRQQKEQNRQAALERHFLGCYTPWLPLELSRFPAITAPTDPQKNRQRLAKLKESLHQNQARIKESIEEHDRLSERIALTAQARILLEAGFKIDRKTFMLPTGDIEGVENSERRNEERKQKNAAVFNGIGTLYGERLFLALQLVHLPELLSKLTDITDIHEAVKRQWTALQCMDKQLVLLSDLHLNMVGLTTLARQLNDDDNDAKLIGNIRLQMNESMTLLDSLARSLVNIKYPFDHATPDITLDRFIIGELPEKDDLWLLIEKGEFALHAMIKLILRTTASLAHLAEEIESAILRDS